jgi:hypothetical protein
LTQSIGKQEKEEKGHKMDKSPIKEGIPEQNIRDFMQILPFFLRIEENHIAICPPGCYNNDRIKKRGD